MQILLALLVWLHAPGHSAAASFPWHVPQLQDVTGTLDTLPEKDRQGILTRLGTGPEQIRVTRPASPAGTMFAVRGVGSICGNVNCEFWRLDAHYRILLDKSTRGYALLPSIHNGRPDIITSMHGSAFESSLSYWRFRSYRYIRIRCADISSIDNNGDPRKTPQITPEPCGTGG